MSRQRHHARQLAAAQHAHPHLAPDGSGLASVRRLLARNCSERGCDARVRRGQDRRRQQRRVDGAGAADRQRSDRDPGHLRDSESIPESAFDRTGTPSTGRLVLEPHARQMRRPPALR
jgi:hypothetical protein